jgi:hypothetical protein
MSTLTERLPDLTDLLDALAPADRRDVEEAYVRVLATAPRRRPRNVHQVVRSHPPAAAAAAVARGLARDRATRAELVADSWSTSEVAERLGISAAAVKKRRGKNMLISFQHKGDWRYPRWQFTGATGVDLGAIAVWQLLPDRHDAVGLVRWFTLPARNLAGRTPAQALHDGDADQVAAAASYIGSR